MKIISKIIVMGCLALAPQLHAQGIWNTHPLTITGTTSSDSVPFNAPSPLQNNFLATWAHTEGGFDYPFYSLYNTNTHWIPSGPQQIPGSLSVDGPVYCSYGANSVSNISLVTWPGASEPGYVPFYSTFDGSNWMNPQQVQNSDISGGFVSSSFNSLNKKFMVNWVYNNSFNPPDYLLPYFAVLHPDGSWGPAASPIPDSVSAGGDGLPIFSTADSNMGSFLVTWATKLGSNTYTSNYAVFDGVSTWTTPAATPIPGVTNPTQAITSVFDPNLGQFFVTWIENTAPYYPYYSIFTPTNSPGNQWTTPGPVSPNHPIGSTPKSVTFASIDPATGTILIIWPDPDGIPTYATYNNGNWITQATPIPNAMQANFILSLSFDPRVKQFMAAWQDGSGNFLVYDIYTLPSSVNIPTTTTVTATPNPSTAKTAVNIQATVTSTSPMTPSGTVTFYINRVPIGQANLDSNGNANFSTSYLCSGTYTVIATYKGNNTFQGSKGSTTLVVN